MNPAPAQNLFRDIAPAQAMQISVADCSCEHLELAAPLAPNINDKGTAFAGSISSLLVLAGWGLVTLRLRDAGIRAEVVVSESQTQYKRPVRAALRSRAEVDPEAFERLVAELTKSPRADIRIQIQLTSEETICATMNANYVVFQTLEN